MRYLFLLFLTLSLAAPLQGQSFDLVAIVDDKVITDYDVVMRTRLLASQSGLDPRSSATIETLRDEALDQLINDAVRLSLAEENEIDIPFEAVEERLQSIAEGNNFSTIDEFGQSLQRSGVQLQALRSLFTAQAAWQGVEQSLFASSIVIEDSAVDAEFARIQATTGAREFRLYEIVIPGSGDAARARANSVYDQVAGGQNFPLLAAQVSGVPSAARDGDLGWRLRSDLGSRARAALDAVELGAVTPPFPSDRGYTLLWKAGERVAGYRVYANLIRVHQLIRLLDSAGQSQSDQADLALLTNLSQQIDDCTRFDQAVQRFGEADSGSLGERDERSFPPPLLEVLDALPIGTPSEVLPLAEDKAGVMVVCSKRREAEALTRDDIQNRLFNEALSELSARRLQQLRREAYIDLNP